MQSVVTGQAPITLVERKNCLWSKTNKNRRSYPRRNKSYTSDKNSKAGSAYVRIKIHTYRMQKVSKNTCWSVALRLFVFDKKISLEIRPRVWCAVMGGISLLQQKCQVGYIQPEKYNNSIPVRASLPRALRSSFHDSD